ncbi:MAG: nucleotidyltransferase domain-containing protein [Bacteroidia bacterium]
METKQDILPQYLKSKHSSLHQLCHKNKVKYLWVFGSVLTDKFKEDSDIDFLYELDKSNFAPGEYLDNLDGLIAGLIEIFPGRKIDLVHYPSLKNPYFIEEVEETKILLYDQRLKEISV